MSTNARRVRGLTHEMAGGFIQLLIERGVPIRAGTAPESKWVSHQAAIELIDVPRTPSRMLKNPS